MLTVLFGGARRCVRCHNASLTESRSVSSSGYRIGVGLCIGFDLDMTLIDPRPGMVTLLELLSGEFDVRLDATHFAENLGPPIDVVLRAAGAPAEYVMPMVSWFRAKYPEVVIPRTVPFPGALSALDAVRALGGRVVVVTGKYEPNAVLHLRALGVDVDAVVGGLWSAEKAAALIQHGASIYVGDHLGDVRGAHAAGALSVAVPSGPCSREELLEAGADVVLESLTRFPSWLTENFAGGNCNSTDQHVR